jgi:Big-like domain-containing protein
MSRNQSAARTQHTRKSRLIALLSWPAAGRLALAAPLAAGLALAAAVIPAGMASARTCNPLTCGGGGPPHYTTTTTVSSSADPSIVGQPVTYTATVSPAPPGGTVQFWDNGFTGTLITGCTAVPVSADGTATCTATPDPGMHMIAAGYQPFQDSSGAWWEPSSSTITQLAGELTAGQSLPAGQSIQSPNGQYTLTMQTDGNLCEYGPDGNALWCTGTYGTGSNDHVTMQTDGNLVIYNSAGTALWDSGTGGRSASGYALDLQNDSNLVIYYPASYIPDGIVWARTSSLTDQLPATLTAGQTISSPDGQYTLTMQTDGNLVEYAPTWTTASGLIAVWASGTNGTGSSNHVTMQPDGNLVIYNSAGTALWTSGTGGHHGSAYTLDLQNDGNLVIYGPGPLWADNV